MYVETHPFNEIIPEGVKALIVGSFPPVKLAVNCPPDEVSGQNKHLYEEYFASKRNRPTSKDKDFYYGSSNNFFWRIISGAFGVDLNSEDEMNGFLTDKGIGITDIIERCKRKSVSRKPTKYNQNNVGIGSLDADLDVIETRDVLKTIKDNNIEKIYCTSEYVKDLLNEERDADVILKGREIHVLPSPSPAYSRAIGRKTEYKKMVADGLVQNTLDYRVKIYKEKFGL